MAQNIYLLTRNLGLADAPVTQVVCGVPTEEEAKRWVAADPENNAYQMILLVNSIDEPAIKDALAVPPVAEEPS